MRRGESGKKHGTTKSNGRTVSWTLRTVATVFVAGVIAAGLSLYSTPCYIPWSAEMDGWTTEFEAVAATPEHLTLVNTTCEFGFPRVFVLENREEDLWVPDDTGVNRQLFLGPSFRNVDIGYGATFFTVAAWTLALGVLAFFLGPYLTRSRIRKLIVPAVAVTLVTSLFVVRGGPETARIIDRTDFVAGWPVGWVVFRDKMGVDFFVTGINEIHILGALTSFMIIWIALAFVASWVRDPEKNL